MKTNLVRLEELVEELAADVGGSCCEASVFVGEIDGKVIHLRVMSKREATESEGYEGLNDNFKCFEK